MECNDNNNNTKVTNIFFSRLDQKKNNKKLTIVTKTSRHIQWIYNIVGKWYWVGHTRWAHTLYNICVCVCVELTTKPCSECKGLSDGEAMGILCTIYIYWKQSLSSAPKHDTFIQNSKWAKWKNNVLPSSLHFRSSRRHHRQPLPLPFHNQFRIFSTLWCSTLNQFFFAPFAKFFYLICIGRCELFKRNE